MDIKTIQTVKWLDALKAVLIDTKLEVQTQLHSSVAAPQSKLLSNAQFVRTKVMEWQSPTHKTVTELTEMIEQYSTIKSTTILLSQVSVDIIHLKCLIEEVKE